MPIGPFSMPIGLRTDPVDALFDREAELPDIPMMTEEHEDADGRRVWLSESEVDDLLTVPDHQQKRIAIELGARCGLRSHEIVKVAPADVVDTDAGTMLTVPEGKGDKYREAPIPETLAATIRSIGEFRDDKPSKPVVEKSTRTLRRWVEACRETMIDETDDDRWQFLTTHDLRRTWAGQLSNADVDQTVALRWGGWDDLETFLNHYRGESTAKAQRREREKVDWI